MAHLQLDCWESLRCAQLLVAEARCDTYASDLMQEAQFNEKSAHRAGPRQTPGKRGDRVFHPVRPLGNFAPYDRADEWTAYGIRGRPRGTRLGRLALFCATGTKPYQVTVSFYDKMLATKSLVTGISRSSLKKSIEVISPPTGFGLRAQDRDNEAPLSLCSPPLSGLIAGPYEQFLKLEFVQG